MSETPTVNGFDGTTEPTYADEPLPPRRWIVPITALIVVVTLIVAVPTYLWRDRSSTPDDTSVDAGFARDMQVHHAQAVEMAMIIRDRTSNPEIRAIAYDIATGQQQQSGQMFAWLQLWGLPQTSSRPAMSWMSDKSHSMTGMSGDGDDGAGMPMGTSDMSMPGMASPQDLRDLMTLRDERAEVLFLRLMIHHHRGGVTMAKQAAKRAIVPQVRRLAQSMVTTQQSEIEGMTTMLRDRGVTPPAP